MSDRDALREQADVEALARVFAEHGETVCTFGKAGDPCRCKCGFVLSKCTPQTRMAHRDEVVAAWLAAHDASAANAARAEGAADAMWQFFLRLKSPTPMSDAVQREAMRLRALTTEGAAR